MELWFRSEMFMWAVSFSLVAHLSVARFGPACRQQLNPAANLLDAQVCTTRCTLSLLQVSAIYSYPHTFVHVGSQRRFRASLTNHKSSFRNHLLRWCCTFKMTIRSLSVFSDLCQLIEATHGRPNPSV